MRDVDEQLLQRDVELALRAHGAQAPIELGVHELRHMRKLAIVGGNGDRGRDLGGHAELERQHRDVVGLLGAFREPRHIAAHQLDQLARMQIKVVIEQRL